MPARFSSLLLLLAMLAVPAFVIAQDAKEPAKPETKPASNEAKQSAAKPDYKAEQEKPADKVEETKPKAEAAKPKDEAKDKAEESKTENAEDKGEETEEKELLAGHSAHGEAFDAGPRQKAYLMGTTGKVWFPVTSKQELVRKFVEQGVGQLHGFWYFEAERSFRQAAALDPDCAIAYWGMAMANANNSKRAKAFITEANDRKDKASRHEQLYIAALHEYHHGKTKADKDKKKKYVEALENIIHDFPDDLEARAFLALTLWKSGRTLSIPSYQAIDSILELVFQKEPMHPAHHYRIHLWDSKKPQRALASAAQCGQSAPGIAHMWHMPGHIYSRLKRYEDAVFQQEASSRVDHAHMIRDHVLPTEIHNYAHNQEWCVRNLIYIGRIRDAMNLSKNLVELPRHPKHNTSSQRSSAASYGRTRLFQVLTTYRLWDEYLALAETVYLDVGDSETDQIKKSRYLGVAHAALGHNDQANEVIKDLEQRETKLKAEQDKAAKEALEKANKSKGVNDKQRKKAQDDARRPFTTRLKAIDQGLKHIRGELACAAEDYKQAIEHFTACRIDKCDLALVHLKSGDKNKAEQLAKEDVDRSKNQCYPLACYVEVLHAAGKHKEAKQRFEELRGISSAIDVDMSVFARLGEFADQYGFERNWRKPAETKQDVGKRPELDSLGPFRWTPPSAESWSLTDAEGKPIGSNNFEGKPVVVIFYLGFGCLHCVEQLQAFAPMTKDFRDAGIELVAIGNDALPDLKQSLKSFENEKEFPFRLAADPEMNVFKRYRAFDDFENVPLHGTFLIDGSGRIRWQDISYDPFTKPKFLLDEAKRLLAQPAP